MVYKRLVEEIRVVIIEIYRWSLVGRVEVFEIVMFGFLV